jgi:hypothetical protein
MAAVLWSPEVRAIFTQAGDAMSAAADQTIHLVKMTPHRVMRELYEQFIAYARAYDETIPTYEPGDDHLANVAISATVVLTNICAAAEFGSAAARAPLVAQSDQPTVTAPLGDPRNPQRFLMSSDEVCPEWTAKVSRFNSDVAAWATTDPQTPVNSWSAEQKALTAAVTPVMLNDAKEMRSLGVRSSNPVLQDLAALASIYQLTYVEALPTYGPADHYLYTTAGQASAMVNAACLATGK